VFRSKINKKKRLSKNKHWKLPYSNKFVNKIRSEKYITTKNTHMYSVCKDA